MTIFTYTGTLMVLIICSVNYQSTMNIYQKISKYHQFTYLLKSSIRNISEMVSGFFDNMYSFINRKTEQMIRSFILKAAYYISFICFTVDSVITYPKSGNPYPWRGKFPIQLASVNFAILLLHYLPNSFPFLWSFLMQ